MKDKLFNDNNGKKKNKLNKKFHKYKMINKNKKT